MIQKVVAVDFAVLGVWLMGLITVEWAALLVGSLGCITGSVALYKAMKALRGLAAVAEQQLEEVNRLIVRTAPLEGSDEA